MPGSKAVRQDLAHLHEAGWAESIKRHLRYGGKLLGICGGYQMLGAVIHDPNGVEGVAGSSDGLGIFNASTELAMTKILDNVVGELSDCQAALTGYEIHMGATTHSADVQSFAELVTPNGSTRSDGARSADGQVKGTYIHGVFDAPATQRALLQWAGLSDETRALDYKAHRNAEIDRVADTLEANMDLTSLSTFFPLK